MYDLSTEFNKFYRTEVVLPALFKMNLEKKGNLISND